MSIHDNLPLQKKPTSLLDDRLRMNFPDKAWNDQQQEKDAIGAVIGKRREQRIGMDAGSERMVVLVEEKLISVDTELRLLAERFLEDLKSVYASSWHILETSPGPNIAMLFADRSSKELDAIPMALVLCVHPDGMLLQITFYLNASACKNRDSWMELAKLMVDSLKPGDRTIERQARTVDLVSHQTPENFKIDVFENIIVTTHEGSDFVSHRFEQVVPLGEMTGSAGIYIGRNPIFHYSHINPPPSISKLSGTLLGQSIEWHCLSVSMGMTTMETIVSVPQSGEQPLRVHAFFTGIDNIECSKLLDLFNTLR